MLEKIQKPLNGEQTYKYCLSGKKYIEFKCAITGFNGDGTSTQAGENNKSTGPEEIIPIELYNMGHVFCKKCWYRFLNKSFIIG